MRSPEPPAAASIRRLDVVDALRGFALFGVAASNVAVFAGTGAMRGPPSPLDTRVGLLAAYLITGKFLALFALTFGVSFGLYLRRCEEKAEPASARYLRRLGGLLLIGAAHRVLFGADILMTYAVLGVVLLLLRNASDRVLLLGAVCSLALPYVWRALAEWLHYRPPPPIVSRAEWARLAVEGPYLELVRVRAVMLTGWWLEFLRQGLGAAAAACGILIWLFELAMSAWWLRRHYRRPVEWLWRSMTYGRFQRMRVVGAMPQRS